MRVAVLTVLVLIAAIAVWALSGPDAALPVPGSPTGGGERAPGIASSDPAAVEPVDSPGATRSVAAIAGGESHGLPIPEDAEWIDVTVVDAETGRPVAGADVWWSNHVQRVHVATLAPERQEALVGNLDAMLHAFGWRDTSNASGVVRVSPGKGGVSVLAQQGKRRGVNHFRGDADPADGFRVEISASTSVQVRVLDNSGEPVPEFPVRLVPHGEENSRSFLAGLGASGVTDAEGIAACDNMQHWQVWHVGDQKGTPVLHWRVSARVPYMDEPSKLVDVQAPPSEPVELQLGPTGSLRVRFVCGARALPHPAGFRLGEVESDVRATTPAGQQNWPRKVEDGGWVTWSHVPVGKRFRVRADKWTFDVDGPAHENQVREHTVDLLQITNVLTGRIVDENGQPVPRTKISMHVMLAKVLATDLARNDEWERLWTDADGVFQWPLARKPGGVRLRVVGGEARQSVPFGVSRVARLPSCELQTGRTDLGDLRLQAGDIVAAGRLAYDVADNYPLLMDVERWEGEGKWKRVGGLVQRSLGDHRFEYRGKVEPGRYRLKLTEWRHLPVEPLEFSLGATDIVWRIRCGQRLRTSVLLPAGLPARRLELDLEPVPGQPDRVASRRADFLREKGARSEWQWSAMEPGEYRLVVRSEASPRPLLTLDRVRVPLPEDDRRLDELDLRELVRPLTVHLKTRGQRVEAVAFLLPQDVALWRGYDLDPGTQVIAALPGPAQLLIAAKDHRPVTRTNVDESAHVTLEPLPVAQLTFVHGADLPQGFQLCVAAESLTESPEDVRRYQTWGNEGTMASLLQHQKRWQKVTGSRHELVLAEGTNRLFVAVVHQSKRHVLRRASVEQLSGGGPCQVQLSEEELAAAVAALRKR